MDVEEIGGRSFEYEEEGVKKSVRFTLSCGVAQFVVGETGKDLMHRADQGLYEAKQKGRNRVAARKHSRLARLLSRS